jgi:hypothetical protein
MVSFIASLLCYRIFSADDTPRWLGIVSGTTLLTALVSGVVCVTAAIFGRFQPNGKVVQNSDKDAS